MFFHKKTSLSLINICARKGKPYCRLFWQVKKIGWYLFAIGFRQDEIVDKIRFFFALVAVAGCILMRIKFR